MEKKSQMVLVDAYSQIFRSFFAVRMLTNSRGEPVNAAYVFTKLLIRLNEDHPSEYGAMLFDCGKVAFRTELNPEYKANRPPMPDALKRQIPLIRTIAEAFGWELLQHEGYEADDLIGGMALKYRELPITIVSSDKDLSQLVDERVTMLVPSGASSGFTRRGRTEVMEKFGVSPELMVDYLAMIGDASDNIPGVPGIGAKGAAEILNKLGPAENWLDAPEKIDGNDRVGRKLLPALDVVRLNRKLIRLRTELPDEWRSAPPVRRLPDWDRIGEICRDNQFTSILKEFSSRFGGGRTPEKDDPSEDLFSFSTVGTAPADGEKAGGTMPVEVQGELF